MMETGLIVIFIVVMMAMGWRYYREKGHTLDSEFNYANRLDQMREDNRVRRFVEDSAREAYEMYKRGGPYYFRGVVVYHVFDEYTAEYKGVDINDLIRARFNELIKENEQGKNI